ncbi:uncharacterized protein KY384_008424 [Bacidia gigantensis]|uniref:uncharacterized protein n=1 Tax=Bacidia gigantensis TaxID=2732470 RepID=UPI001D03EC15|nr:uncharacterized protein KY384_008424 [Bacidia gigantensis]KAG8526995.1 hypothetical protein KY384_008424 [Bacidia gigantensis]
MSSIEQIVPEKTTRHNEEGTGQKLDVEVTSSHLVCFNRSDDPLDPQNWPARKKCNLATLMCAPAAPVILEEFSSANRLYEVLQVSIWELGEAFGPLLIAPLSEMYGRAPIYHAANVLFCIFSVASALSSSLSMLITFRFFNGIAVASVVLNPSIVGDIFITEERGGAMSILTVLPLLGPCIGPVIGGYVTQSIGWRWLFWLAAVFAGVVEIAFAFFFCETYKVQILRRKARLLRKQTGDPMYRSEHDVVFDLATFLTTSIIRPVRMTILSPIIFLLSLYVAVVFAYTYILFTTLTKVFGDNYQFSTSSASLTFLGLGKIYLACVEAVAEQFELTTNQVSAL